ncbi:iron-containing alcohol dehydrogenase [Deinococcus planocerae]|uniref:iron-containing alcohol dehydrogenase n=1 Tax=Deinococcus planocerae TaxID=1737569 RepID=UPI0015E1336E|nr:iron-containing alcohol dehydrogenase [Deinococcus planocerae]
MTGPRFKGEGRIDLAGQTVPQPGEGQLLTASMPVPLTVMTGLDALVQAVEACTGRARNDEASGWGLEAIRLIRRHLPEAVRSPDDLAARAGMQRAALTVDAWHRWESTPGTNAEGESAS